MNMMAISPELVMSMLQNQNIKREVAPKMERKIKKEETENENKEEKKENVIDL